MSFRRVLPTSVYDRFHDVNARIRDSKVKPLIRSAKTVENIVSRVVKTKRRYGIAVRDRKRVLYVFRSVSIPVASSPSTTR